MKTYDVTIQMKPLQQYFHPVLFVFQLFTKWNLEILLNFVGNFRNEMANVNQFIFRFLMKLPLCYMNRANYQSKAASTPQHHLPTTKHLEQPRITQR